MKKFNIKGEMWEEGGPYFRFTSPIANILQPDYRTLYIMANQPQFRIISNGTDQATVTYVYTSNSTVSIDES